MSGANYLWRLIADEKADVVLPQETRIQTPKALSTRGRILGFKLVSALTMLNMGLRPTS